jgi:hypothetical protein
MNTQLAKNQTLSFETETAISSQRDYLNFERWASEVRRQMLDSLQKKGTQREAKKSAKKTDTP